MPLICTADTLVGETVNITRPSAKSYPQDGLIGQYDGEENAGYMQHDFYATTWKDLKGGYGDFTIVNNGITIGRNYYQTTRSASAYNTVPYNMVGPYFQPLFANSASLTISCLFKSTGSTDPRWIGADPFQAQLLETWNSNSHYSGRIKGCRCEITSTTITGNVLVGATLSYTATGATSGSLTYYVRKGGSTYSTTATTSYSDTTKRRLTLGAWSGIQFYRLLIYNRALSASDVAAVHAVDNQRFGLA